MGGRPGVGLGFFVGFRLKKGLQCFKGEKMYELC